MIYHLALLSQLTLGFLKLALESICILLENRILIGEEFKLFSLRCLGLLPIHLTVIELRLDITVALFQLLHLIRHSLLFDLSVSLLPLVQ